jgi:septal ring factor EnvC (AmiA/AmiB activator)
MYKSVDTINEKLTNIDSDINEYSKKLEQDKKEKKHLQSSLKESVTIIKSLEDEINELDKIL